MQSTFLPADLRKRGYRLTPQRLAILNILESEPGHLTPNQVFERAHARLPGITEATVYRTLEFLAGQGLAQVAFSSNGRLAYEAAGHAHHHLVCRTCGQAVEIDGSALRSLYEHFHTQTGFRVDSSHVTFFGTCPECSQV